MPSKRTKPTPDAEVAEGAGVETLVAPTCDTCGTPLGDWRDLRAWHASPPTTREELIGKAPKPGSKRKQKTRSVVIPHHATCRRCLRVRERRALAGTYARTTDGVPISGYSGLTVTRTPDGYKPVEQAAAMQRRRGGHESLLATIKPKRMRGCLHNDAKDPAPFERLPEAQKRAIRARQQQQRAARIAAIDRALGTTAAAA